MAHAHESNTKRIWIVFGILSLITIVEVLLGIYKPDSLFRTHVLSSSLLNWIFIILTVVKAYYIMWAFMHLEGEKASFRWSIVAPLVFLILYLCFIVLVEGDYIYEVFRTGHLKWIF
ncbi:cytochrome C oxidase subunit IV [Flavobacterium sp. 316]|uniref:Cytochrome C oxidase subunit IV family protein n=1 Tax=Flavobacterium sediminilitoris TaxID=2024526 RepID=A0ABY4HR81_9FLAO|nr:MULTISPECIES: cytochrome C oxidase subunit IV family protein [Flavobacterium]KIX20926.1 cytochrome C oxidase subunit IV [Flavobacterium sp. 316]UOX35411.1 cytochrome C oxidase subunit IV family protein [Flavobacterium sediminilitoris]